MAYRPPEVTEAKVQLVRDTLARAVEDGADVSIRGIARAAGVDHVFILRRPELRDQILSVREQILALRPAGSEPDAHLSTGAVTLSDYETDLVHQARGETLLARYFHNAVLKAVAADLGITPATLDIELISAPRRRGRAVKGGRPASLGYALTSADVYRARGGVPLTADEADLVRRAMGGMPMARYFREAVLSAVAADLGISLDEVDTPVRRQSPRRPNYAQRQDKQQQQGSKLWKASTARPARQAGRLRYSCSETPPMSWNWPRWTRPGRSSEMRCGLRSSATTGRRPYSLTGSSRRGPTGRSTRQTLPSGRSSPSPLSRPVQPDGRVQPPWLPVPPSPGVSPR